MDKTSMRLFHWTFRRKTTIYRRTDFRVVEKTPARITIRTRNHALLAGGSIFVGAGISTWTTPPTRGT